MNKGFVGVLLLVCAILGLSSLLYVTRLDLNDIAKKHATLQTQIESFSRAATMKDEANTNTHRSSVHKQPQTSIYDSNYHLSSVSNPSFPFSSLVVKCHKSKDAGVVFDKGESDNVQMAFLNSGEQAEFSVKVRGNDAVTLNATGEVKVHQNAILAEGKVLDVSKGVLKLANDQISGEKLADEIPISKLNVTSLSCPTGQSIRQINDDGSVKCEINWNSPTYSSGEGQVVATQTVANGQTIVEGDAVSLYDKKLRKGLEGPIITANFSFGAQQLISSTAMMGGDSYSMPKMAMLSSTSFISTYLENYNPNHNVLAYVSTVSGSTITTGSVATVGTVGGMAVCALDSSKVLFGYAGKARVGSISGTTISLGPELSDCTGYEVVCLSSTRGVVLDAAGAGIRGQIVDVSGTTLSATGSRTYIAGADSYSLTFASTLTSSTFLVAYRAHSASSAFVVHVTVSGSTITASSPVLFSDVSAHQLHVASLTPTTFVVVYLDYSYSIPGTYVRPGKVSGTTITLGNNYMMMAGTATSHTWCSKAADNEFVAVWSYQHVAYILRGSLDPATPSLTFKGNYVPLVLTGNPQYDMVGRLTDTSVVFVYRSRDTGFATGVLIDIGTYQVPSDLAKCAYGVANANGTSGEQIPVLRKGITNKLSGLTPDVTYYPQADGSFAPTAGPLGTRVGGKALSAEDMQLLGFSTYSRDAELCLDN